jgi:hypothetical protein
VKAGGLLKILFLGPEGAGRRLLAGQQQQRCSRATADGMGQEDRCPGWARRKGVY